MKIKRKKNLMKNVFQFDLDMANWYARELYAIPSHSYELERDWKKYIIVYLYSHSCDKAQKRNMEWLIIGIPIVGLVHRERNCPVLNNGFLEEFNGQISKNLLYQLPKYQYQYLSLLLFAIIKTWIRPNMTLNLIFES